MKKILSIILSISIIATICSQCLFAYASVNILSSNVNAEYKKTFDVPVSISGNNDLMGFAFEISYDSSAVKPLVMTPSPTLENGTFNDSIGSDVYVNPIRVVWADTQPLTSNGELFTVKFEALSMSTSSITISAIDIDTFDSSYNQVSIPDCTITVNTECKHQCTLYSIAPTCISKGADIYTCEICKETFVKYTDEIDHTISNNVTKATLSADGRIEAKCSVCNKITSTQSIAKPSVIQLTATSYTYDGKVKKPGVVIKDSKGNAVESSNYTVTYAGACKAVGKYAVKITFKGNYSGTKTLYFTIVPKGTTISSVASASKSMTVKWKKQAAQTAGYQIQYSTDKNFKKNNKTVTVSKNSTTSKKLTKLNGGKKYYVRIRTYKKVGSANYYSTWSKVKAVTIKK